MEKNKIKLFMRKNYSLVILFSIFFLLLFLNFDNIYLWHDEASTALLGKSIIKYGYPRAYDGKNWLKATPQHEIGIYSGEEAYNKDLVWVSHSWLPYYITALSFKLFRYSTFSARFFFVLFGFASLFLIYKLFNMLYSNKKVSYLAMLILLTSTYFFLFNRQVRYYSLTLFFTMGLLIFYINILKRRRIKDIFLFSFFGIMLFHSHHLSFFIVFLSLAIHFFFFSKWRRRTKQIVLSFILITIFTLPWFIYAKVWSLGTRSSFLDPSNLLLGFAFIIKSINYHYPLILLIFLLLLLKKKGKTRQMLFGDKFLFVFIFFPIILATMSPAKLYRYIFNFFPLVLLFFSRLYYISKEKGRIIQFIALIFLVLLMTTNILPIIPTFIVGKIVKEPLNNLCIKYAPLERKHACEGYIGGVLKTGNIKFPIFYYLYEITHDYDGPNEGIVKYLLKNAKKDDIVFAYFAGYYIQFYTDLRVLDPPQYMNTTLKPDWIVYRWKRGSSTYLKEYAIKNNYKEIELPYPDLYYENRPNMISHRYWTARDVPNLVIYQRPDYNQKI